MYKGPRNFMLREILVPLGLRAFLSKIEMLFWTVILFWHFFPKFNMYFFLHKISFLILYLASYFSVNMFLSENHCYFVLGEILFPSGPRPFLSNIDVSFIFFFRIISFLFESQTFKYTIYKFWGKYYDILFWTKFLSKTSWWLFDQYHQEFFFSHKIPFLFVSGTYKFGVYKFSTKNREILFLTIFSFTTFYP